jgi:hypothetical protein
MHQSPDKRMIEAKVKAIAPPVLMVIVTHLPTKRPSTIKKMKPRTTTPTIIKGKKEYNQV